LCDVSQETVLELKNDLPGVNFKTNEFRAKDKTKLVILLELDASVDCEKVYKFIKEHQLESVGNRLCVSIVTEHYMGGVLVPKFALQLLCRLGWDVSFSYLRI